MSYEAYEQSKHVSAGGWPYYSVAFACVQTAPSVETEERLYRALLDLRRRINGSDPYAVARGRSLTMLEYPFQALLFALLRESDTDNTEGLHAEFPNDYAEFLARYNAPGGLLPNELFGRLENGSCEDVATDV